ncbi:MAG: hypothetical protein WBM69_26140 [Desulfobacterales bacterium]
MMKRDLFVFHDFPSPGLTGELVGNSAVRIVSKDGDIVQQRNNPRSAFKKLRRVRPILFADKPLPRPILIALDIHAIRPV